MKKGKIVLSVSALLLSVIGSFAFKSDANGRFGQGTQFIRVKISDNPPVFECQPVNCKKADPSPTLCPLQTYYSTSNCTDVGNRFQPKAVGA